MNARTTELTRRRRAAERLPALDCGCRDPWPCRCTEPSISPAALEGWRKAITHILTQGQVPLVPIEVRRAFWKRTEDRELAEFLHEACSGEVL